ncbi:hypothetical protein AUK22_01140 [bacterium CG2_30_54_10]|nr:MAG: hypothetical protein AUK22_01140 [bacterium CG2_30_54_10]
MADRISLKTLQLHLSHPGKAIKKRALAVLLRYVLTVVAIRLYFKKGNRSQASDRICFKAMQNGVLEVNEAYKTFLAESWNE